MKTTFAAIILSVLATTSLLAQTKPGELIDHQKHMQAMAMLKDSSVAEMLLSNIAADHSLRIRMAERIAEYTGKDTTARHEVCATLMKGMTMTEGVSGCGMMKHESMHGKTNELEKGKQEKENHDKPHKH